MASYTSTYISHIFLITQIMKIPLPFLKQMISTSFVTIVSRYKILLTLFDEKATIRKVMMTSISPSSNLKPVLNVRTFYVLYLSNTKLYGCNEMSQPNLKINYCEKLIIEHNLNSRGQTDNNSSYVAQNRGITMLAGVNINSCMLSVDQNMISVF